MSYMKVALQEIKEDVESGSSVSIVQALHPVARRSEKSWRIAAVAMALVLLAAIIGYFLRPEPEQETVLRLTNPVQVTTNIAILLY